MYWVYMIRNDSNELYIGITKNPQQRLRYHNENRGAVFTRASQFEMVFLEQQASLVAARTREIQFKKWRREKKEALIRRYQQGLPTALDRA